VQLPYFVLVLGQFACVSIEFILLGSVDVCMEPVRKPFFFDDWSVLLEHFHHQNNEKLFDANLVF